jgi:hypothetical protein
LTQSHKPAKQHAVIDLLHQQSLADRVQHAQQRPLAYVLSNYRDNWAGTSSTMDRIARSGWSFRTRISGEK